MINKLAFTAALLALFACTSQDTKSMDKKLDDMNRKLDALIAKGGQGGGANARPPAQQREEAAPDAVFAVDITPNLKKGMIEGPATALVTIVEAWDFACPYCQRVGPTLQQLVKDYNGKVRIVFKNLVVHPQVVSRAHLVGCAAAAQGKFAEFYHAFWDKSYKPYQESRDATKLSEEAILSWAPSIGLDAAKLKADMDGPDCKALLDADAAEPRKYRVGSTPSFFINGNYVAGAMDVDGFKRIIDAKLKIAEASGTPAAEYYDKEVIGKGEKQFRAAGAPKLQ